MNISNGIRTNGKQGGGYAHFFALLHMNVCIIYILKQCMTIYSRHTYPNAGCRGKDHTHSRQP